MAAGDYYRPLDDGVEGVYAIPRRGLGIVDGAPVLAKPRTFIAVTKFAHLTTRTENKLNRGQAHAAIAAAILRQLYAVVSKGQRWDAAIAAGGRCEVIEPAA